MIIYEAQHDFTHAMTYHTTEHNNLHHHRTLLPDDYIGHYIEFAYRNTQFNMPRMTWTIHIYYSTCLAILGLLISWSHSGIIKPTTIE